MFFDNFFDRFRNVTLNRKSYSVYGKKCVLPKDGDTIFLRSNGNFQLGSFFYLKIELQSNSLISNCFFNQKHRWDEGASDILNDIIKDLSTYRPLCSATSRAKVDNKKISKKSIKEVVMYVGDNFYPRGTISSSKETIPYLTRYKDRFLSTLEVVYSNVFYQDLQTLKNKGADFAFDAKIGDYVYDCYENADSESCITHRNSFFKVIDVKDEFALIKKCTQSERYSYEKWESVFKLCKVPNRSFDVALYENGGTMKINLANPDIEDLNNKGINIITR